ncbi:hypothetical protein D9M71_49300 [compost metagenome]
MARHQDQQGIRVAGKQLAMRRQHHFVFAFMGTGGDPHGPTAGLPLLTQLHRTLQQLCIDREVELYRTRHLDARRKCAQPAKAFGFCFGLYGNKAHFFKHWPGQAGEPRITASRTFGQTPVGQCHRNAAQRALVDMIGPQLGFHDNRQFRLDPVKETRRSPRQVIGQIAVLDAVFPGKHRLDPFGTGRRHAGDGDWQVRITLKQRADHRRGSNALAHRHGVHPDTASTQRWQAEGKTLANATGIGRRLARAQVQAQRYQGQAEMEQQGIKSSVHRPEVY